MKKNSLLLLTLASLILTSCGPSNLSSSELPSEKPDVSSSTSDVESNSSESSSEEIIDEEITLRMYGDLYLNGFRSIYATLKNNTKDHILWKSSNPSVISIMERSDINGEAFVAGEDYGSATITAYLENHPSIKKEINLTVSKGEAMPLDLYNTLSSSAKVLTDDYVYTHDLNTDKENLDEHFKLETTFEEYNEFDGDEFNSTDCYEFKSTNTKNDRVDYHFSYVRGPKNFVSEEYLTLENTVGYNPKLNSDGNGMPWATSLYFNMLGNPNVSNNELFRTFDGGKTYHFIGIETQRNIITASLYMLDFTADDLYFTVDGDNVTLTAYMEPFRSMPSQTFRSSRKFVSQFSELGFAEIEHVYPYDPMPYSKNIKKALQAIVNGGNYTADWTLKFKQGLEASIRHKFKFTINDMFEESYRNGELQTRVGVHNDKNDSYYEYHIESGIGYQNVIIDKKYDKGWFNHLNRMLPSFNFAAEIFEPVEGQPNTYQTIGNQGALVMRAALLSNEFVFYDFPGKAYLTLDDNGNLKQIKTDVTDKDGMKKMEVIIDYSNIGTTKVEYDFDHAQDGLPPANWEEEDARLYKELKAWKLDEVVPFLHAENGFNDWVSNKLDDKQRIAFAFIDTENFDNTANRDKYIADYKTLLVEQGWVKTGAKEEYTGYDLYKKGAYQIGVGIRMNGSDKFGYNETDSVRIIIASDLLVKPEIE